MAVDADGLPVVGPYAFALGVRTGARPWDIVVDVNGWVAPAERGKGGMSVTPANPERLPPRHRPASLGGSGMYPVWRLDLADIGPALAYRQTSETHGLLEPAYPMPLRDYEEALEGTRKHWQRIVE